MKCKVVVLVNAVGNVDNYVVNFSDVDLICGIYSYWLRTNNETSTNEDVTSEMSLLLFLF